MQIIKIIIENTDEKEVSQEVKINKDTEERICPVPNCGKRKESMGRRSDGKQHFRGLCRFHIKMRKKLRLERDLISAKIEELDKLSTGQL